MIFEIMQLKRHLHSHLDFNLYTCFTKDSRIKLAKTWFHQFMVIGCLNFPWIVIKAREQRRFQLMQIFYNSTASIYLSTCKSRCRRPDKWWSDNKICAIKQRVTELEECVHLPETREYVPPFHSRIIGSKNYACRMEYHSISKKKNPKSNVVIHFILISRGEMPGNSI